MPVPDTPPSYDIIGDIHGHADELKALLERMGYTRRAGHYVHPDRQAVFVGDFIDRGPQIAEVLEIVRPMIDGGAAQAVMGNHEFNAIAFHTRDPADRNRFLRERSEKNVRQHRETLIQLTAAELHDAIEWFRTLPMWLDLNGIRVVHACWNDRLIPTIRSALNDFGGITTEFLQTAVNKKTPLFAAIDDVLKGTELTLPDGHSYQDKDGQQRTQIRTRWFESPAGKTYREYALSATEEIPDEPLPADMQQTDATYPQSGPPVIVGHYWMSAARPTCLAANVACVDFSVAKGGFLCAYRWDGESSLSDNKFCVVETDDSVAV